MNLALRSQLQDFVVYLVQLKDASGQPLHPAGKLVYDMAVPAVQQFYATVTISMNL